MTSLQVPPKPTPSALHLARMRLHHELGTIFIDSPSISPCSLGLERQSVHAANAFPRTQVAHSIICLSVLSSLVHSPFPRRTDETLSPALLQQAASQPVPKLKKTAAQRREQKKCNEGAEKGAIRKQAKWDRYCKNHGHPLNCPCSSTLGIRLPL